MPPPSYSVDRSSGAQSILTGHGVVDAGPVLPAVPLEPYSDGSATMQTIYIY